MVNTLTSIQQIDNLDFYVLKMNITYQNKILLRILLYNRLFDKQMFILNIIYQDEKIGQEMLDAWENSTFEK